MKFRIGMDIRIPVVLRTTRFEMDPPYTLSHSSAEIETVNRWRFMYQYERKWLMCHLLYGEAYLRIESEHFESHQVVH